MPIYEYKCLKCSNDFEAMQKFSDAPISKCPSCGGRVKKKMSNTSFQLKGSGWYMTDYAKKGTRSPSTETSDTKDSTPATASDDVKSSTSTGTE
ncbi:MAG TPA: zinc ribbon domain-containing protein [Desulfomonilia bacterium]|jgi:putative FmdB family regulatory protein